MGIDTRFWGPSGWQLFHLIAFRSKHPEDVLQDMKDVLPCPFCRESTTKFVKEHPLRGDPGRWLYDIHNMVNAKLRGQADEDPSVIDPGPDPTFEEIKVRYLAMKPTAIPGRDFLMAVAYNYPESPEPKDMSIQREFIKHLGEAYPFEELRKVVEAYGDPDLTNQKTYTKWMHGLLVRLAKATKTSIRSYRGFIAHVAYYKSGCARKTYKGKTCRRLSGGGRTKDRDYKRTRRVTSKGLL